MSLIPQGAQVSSRSPYISEPRLLLSLLWEIRGSGIRPRVLRGETHQEIAASTFLFRHEASVASSLQAPSEQHLRALHPRGLPPGT